MKSNKMQPKSSVVKRLKELAGLASDEVGLSNRGEDEVGLGGNMPFSSVEAVHDAWQDIYDDLAQRPENSDKVLKRDISWVNKVIPGYDDQLSLDADYEFEYKYGKRPMEFIEDLKGSNEPEQSDDEEIDTPWIDPAGGTHAPDEEDPAWMYKENSYKLKDMISEVSDMAPVNKVLALSMEFDGAAMAQYLQLLAGHFTKHADELTNFDAKKVAGLLRTAAGVINQRTSN